MPSMSTDKRGPKTFLRIPRSFIADQKIRPLWPKWSIKRYLAPLTGTHYSAKFPSKMAQTRQIGKIKTEGTAEQRGRAARTALNGSRGDKYQRILDAAI